MEFRKVKGQGEKGQEGGGEGRPSLQWRPWDLTHSIHPGADRMSCLCKAFSSRLLCSLLVIHLAVLSFFCPFPSFSYLFSYHPPHFPHYFFLLIFLLPHPHLFLISFFALPFSCISLTPPPTSSALDPCPPPPPLHVLYVGRRVVFELGRSLERQLIGGYDVGVSTLPVL